MYKLLFLSLLLFTFVSFAQPEKPSFESFFIEEIQDSARYYYYYSPRPQSLIIDYDRWDVWSTYVIDSTYFPGTERFPDGTYRRWKRAPDGKLLPVEIIASKSMRAVFLADTATFLPHWSGEIPRR